MKLFMQGVMMMLSDGIFWFLLALSGFSWLVITILERFQ